MYSSPAAKGSTCARFQLQCMQQGATMDGCITCMEGGGWKLVHSGHPASRCSVAQYMQVATALFALCSHMHAHTCILSCGYQHAPPAACAGSMHLQLSLVLSVIIMLAAQASTWHLPCLQPCPLAQCTSPVRARGTPYPHGHGAAYHAWLR